MIIYSVYTSRYIVASYKATESMHINQQKMFYMKKEGFCIYKNPLIY